SGLTMSFMETHDVVMMRGYDLYLRMKEGEQGLVGTLWYNTDLFEVGTITRLVDDFETLLGLVVVEPDMKLHEVEERLAAKHKQQLLIQEKELEEASVKKLQTIRRKRIST